ncbi:hypothetical protein D3C85_1262930 [compost metagenome]
MIQPVVVRARLQLREAFANRLIRLRRDPKPFERLLPADQLHNPARDEFAFAPRIGCNDQLGEVTATAEMLNGTKLLRRFFHDFELHFAWNNGEIF